MALKQILDRHADDPASRQRFLLEAEITGGLEHPGIVPVYGLGTYADGRPFYAMRFIRGDSLKEAIERFHADEALKSDPGRRSLELRKLLRRFTRRLQRDRLRPQPRRAAPRHQAGQHHRRQARRDPGGRLGPGQAARPGRTAGRLGRADAGALLGQRHRPRRCRAAALGTPAYMSPEQAAGRPRAPRAPLRRLQPGGDALLPADRPAAVRGATSATCSGPCRRGEFPPPRQLDPSIDPALEAVCLKAMAPRPEDRYASPQGPGRGHRAVDGRRAGLGLARAAVAARAAVGEAEPDGGDGGGGGAGRRGGRARGGAGGPDRPRPRSPGRWRETQANQALAAANAELARSKAAVQARYDLAVEAIKTFHTGVSEDFLLKEEQFKDLRDRLLKSASDFYGKLGALLGRETDLALAAGAGAVELRAGRADGQGRPHRGRTGGAPVGAGGAAGAGGRAGGRRRGDGRGRPEPDGRSPGCWSRRGRPTRRWRPTARPRRCWPARRRGRPRPAPRWRPAGRGWAGSSPRSAGTRRRWRRTAWRGPTRRRWPQSPGRPNEARRDLADTVSRIGVLLSETGKPAEAEAEYRRALAIQQKLADDHPAVADFRDGLANSHNNLGILLMATGRPAEAEAEYRAALAIRQKLADDHPAVTEFRSRLAGSHHNLGNLLSDDGQAGGGRVGVPTGDPDLSKAGRRESRRHPVPAVPGESATIASAAC